jgi:hypothetical protein
MNSSLKTAGLVTLTAVAGLAIYSMFGGAKKDDAKLLPALTEDETKEMMEKILIKLKIIAGKMMRAGENIKQQIQASGQDVDDLTVYRSYILPHLNVEFKKAQEEVLDEYDVDEDELKDANTEYMKDGHKGLVEITKSIRRIYKDFGGEVGEYEGLEGTQSAGSSSTKSPAMSSGGAPQEGGTTAERMEDLAVQLLSVLADKMITNTEMYILTFKEKYGIPSTAQEFEMFQQGLMVITEGVEKQLLEEHGLDQSDFQQLLMKQSESPKIQRIFMEMQYRNQIILQSNGIQMQYGAQ